MSVGHERLQRLMQRGTDFLGCEVAILGGAMTWVSDRHLVAAISNAGVERSSVSTGSSIGAAGSGCAWRWNSRSSSR